MNQQPQPQPQLQSDGEYDTPLPGMDDLGIEVEYAAEFEESKEKHQAVEISSDSIVITAGMMFLVAVTSLAIAGVIEAFFHIHLPGALITALVIMQVALLTFKWLYRLLK